MPNVRIQCRYCGYLWKHWLWGDSAIEDLKCLKCDDKNLKIIEYVDAFGYDSQAPKKDAYVKKGD